MVIRTGREWTHSKLDFLEKYLPAFTTACKTARSTAYVDGFAGPGVNEMPDGAPRRGSPIIALDTVPAFNAVHLVEMDAAAFEALAANVDVHERKPATELYRDDFNAVAPRLLSDIPSRRPTFFLLDPDGMDLEWRTLELIAERERVDALLLVPTSGIVRNAHLEAVTPRITRWYGSDDWQTLRDRFESGEFGAGRAFDEVLMEDYLERLNGLGFQYVEKYLVARTSRNRQLHAWVFLGKHDVGLKIAQYVINDLYGGKQPALPF